MEERIMLQQLQKILSTAKVDHVAKVCAEPTLKHAHIYCKLNNLSGQVSGLLLESYIVQKYNLTRNSPSQCKGDACGNISQFLVNESGQRDIEIKISNGGESHQHFNFVQIRFNHATDYLFSAYLLNQENFEKLGEHFLFYIQHQDIIPILTQFGSCAHGTKKRKLTSETLTEDGNITEYALRVKYNSKGWKSLLPFRILF